MAERSLRFDLIATDKSFGKTLGQMGRKGERLQRDMSRGFGRAGDDAGKRFGVRFNKRLGGGFSASTGIVRKGAGLIAAGFAAAGVAKFAADSVSMAASFDKTMRQVAVATKTPTRRMSQLRDVALDMGAKTSFSAREAGDAMLSLGKGGLSFAEQKAGALQATLTLAAAGGIELGESAGFVVQGLKTFGLRASRAADVAAALAGGANASTASVEDLGEALSQVGPGARNAGLSIQETAGVLASFADNGIKGSDAGTSLKTMLTRLVPVTKLAKDAMRDLGLKFTDSQGAMLPIAEIAERIRRKFKDLTDAERTKAMATIFGSDATRAATVLMNEGAAGLAKYIRATKDRGAAEKLAATNTSGASGAFERLQGTIETLQIQIGDAFLPVLADAATWLATTLPKALKTLREDLRTAKKWWDDNQGAIKTLGDALNTIFVPAADSAADSTKNLNTSTKSLRDTLSSLLEGTLRITQGFIMVARLAGNTSLRILDLISAGGHLVNVVDRLSGGTGHAGDKMVDWARDMKTQTRVQLGKLEQDAKDTQRAIDKLHGKNVDITGTTSLHFTKTFTQGDWLNAREAAGRMAAGGKIPGFGGGDTVPILAEKGEAVVDKVRTRKFAAVLGAMGVPGFARGGPILATKIGQTGRAHSGVGRQLDMWSTILMAAGIKKMMAGTGKPAITAFLRGLDSHPYVWGGAGPGGYDCSGIVGAAHLGHQGRPYGHGQRIYTTSSIRAGVGGLKPGLGGVLDIGVTEGTGHMAGRYGGPRGLGFEAESTRTGIKIGAAASRPESFARKFHLAKGGKIDPALVDLFARSGAEVGGDPGKLRINGQTFDRGGWLRPGVTVAHNRTGRPERVLGPGESTGIDYDRLAKAIVLALHANPLRASVDAGQARQGIKDHQRRGGVPRPSQLR